MVLDGVKRKKKMGPRVGEFRPAAEGRALSRHNVLKTMSTVNK